jgi:hypothetical protein
MTGRRHAMIGPAGQVVVRHADGRLLKGYTYDFALGRRRFHVFAARDASTDPSPVLLGDLKAVFFIRDHAGNPRYHERKEIAAGGATPGRPVEVTFSDGEVIEGITTPQEVLRVTLGETAGEEA